MRPIFTSTACLLLLAGCVSSINLRNAEGHAQAGYAAQNRGDWEGAARQFAQAVVNADLGNGEPQGKATVNYEYGRAMAVLCKYEDAEKYLLRAKEFNEKSGISPFLPVYELGSLNVFQKKYSAAIPYFVELIPLMEREGLRSRAPLGVADAYEKYAISLEAVGRSAEAVEQRKQARAIREANPNAKPVGGGTPYGTRCKNS